MIARLPPGVNAPDGGGLWFETRPYRALQSGPLPADVESKARAAHDVEMAVGLRLEAVVAEVGEDTEAVGTVLLAHPDRQGPESRQDRSVGPELDLGHVLFGHEEEHDRHPVEMVVENDEVVFLVSDPRGQTARNDLAESAVAWVHRLVPCHR